MGQQLYAVTQYYSVLYRDVPKCFTPGRGTKAKNLNAARTWLWSNVPVFGYFSALFCLLFANYVTYEYIFVPFHRYLLFLVCCYWIWYFSFILYPCNLHHFISGSPRPPIKMLVCIIRDSFTQIKVIQYLNAWEFNN